MTPFRPFFLVPLAVALAAGCADRGLSTGPITHLPRDLTASETHLVATNNDFAFRLFQEVARQQSPDSNLFISPLSVAMALGMTYNGAAGTTEQAMQSALGLSGMSRDEINQSYRGVIDLLRGLDPRVDFTLANSIWYRPEYNFEQSFLDVTHTYFDAQVQGLDFSAPGAVQTINDWVSEQTRGRIPGIVEAPIPDYIVMYLIDAIYFKGGWTNRFDATKTRPGTFTLADGSTSSPVMMSYADPASVRYAVAGGGLVLDLRYGGGAYSMTIVLPARGTALDSFVAGLTRQRWDGWIAALDSGAAGVTMPKFKLEYKLKMNAVLAALGMGVAFIPPPCAAPGPDCADFTRMRLARDLYIDEVLHKTYVDVNEEGTEAAAVTSVAIGIVTCCSGPPWFDIDRPFLFAIRERFSGTILFMGRIMNPAAT